ncbi:deoxyribodipyrimidine photo-lyase, partial [Muriicola sp.]
MKKVSIFWFRRDLRLEDNTGLMQALKGDVPVLPVFIFDPEILQELPENDARVSFIHSTLQDLRNRLKEDHGSSV